MVKISASKFLCPPAGNRTPLLVSGAGAGERAGELLRLMPLATALGVLLDAAEAAEMRRRLWSSERCTHRAACCPAGR